MGKFKPGDVCIVDKDNKKLRQKTDGFSIVVIDSKPKTGFLSTKYDVFIPSKNTYMKNLPEEVLEKIEDLENFKKAKELVIVRNPIDMPEITDADIATINSAINIVCDNDVFSEEDRDIVNSGLLKLLTKLEFYNSMKEV